MDKDKSHDNRDLISHLAKYYTASELAECLLACNVQPDTHFWTHLDAIRAARLPDKIKTVTRRLESLRRSKKLTRVMSPAESRLTTLIIDHEFKLAMLNRELARLTPKQKQETAA